MPVALALVSLLAVPTTAAAVGVGSRAPEIGLDDSRGNHIRIGRYRGKVLIVNVWATWCEPCRDELPAYQRLYSRYFRRGLRVVGVNVDRDEGAMRRFVERNGVLFPVVHDGDRAVAQRWGGNTMPTTWVVGPRGVVRFVNDGYHAGDERRVERVVRELLADVDGGGESEQTDEARRPADEAAADAASGADEAEPGRDGVEDDEEAAAGPADAPPEVEPSGAGRSGGLCTTAPGSSGVSSAWLLAALLLVFRLRRRGR